jgi:hypothetical protein
MFVEPPYQSYTDSSGKEPRRLTGLRAVSFLNSIHSKGREIVLGTGIGFRLVQGDAGRPLHALVQGTCA